MNNKYIKSLGGEEHIEMLGTEGRITAGEGSRRDDNLNRHDQRDDDG